MLNVDFHITKRDTDIDLLLPQYHLCVNSIEEGMMSIKVMEVQLSSELAMHIFHV